MTRKPKLTDLDAPRIRFNWGYHDAAHDHRTGHVRLLVDYGEASVKHVSFATQGAYAYGYQEGLRDARAGEYREWSEQAWNRCREVHTMQARFEKAFKRQNRRSQ